MLPAIQCNIGVDIIFEANNWNSQVYHTEIIMSTSSSHNLKLMNINKREYNEYMDIKLRHDEQYHEQSYQIPNNTIPGTNLESQISSKKYA
jgi:hypothetical protein